MTCFQVDDQLSSNTKILTAIEEAGHGVVSLWTLVGSMCGAHNTEGVIEQAVINAAARTLGMAAGERDKVTAALAVAIWHPAAKARRCAPCTGHLAELDVKLKPGSYLWHDWGQQPWQLSKREAKDPVEAVKRKRRKHLDNSPEGKAAKRFVRERDGNVCRYCGCPISSFHDTVSERGGTLDHKNPMLLDVDDNFARANHPDNLVVACRTCNGRKGNRTPEEWAAEGGYDLRPAPGEAAS